MYETVFVLTVLCERGTYNTLRFWMFDNKTLERLFGSMT
jgi:hypothetical protein